MVRISDATWDGMQETTATLGLGSGPTWDDYESAWYDQGASGLYSYDGGASWEPKRPTYTPPPVSTAGALASLENQPGSYSLTGSGFNNFNINTLTPPDAETDGLGHWWDSSVQAWRNDDGSLYEPLQSAPPPVSTQGALDYLDTLAAPTGNPWGNPREPVQPPAIGEPFWSGTPTAELPGWEGQSVPASWIPDYAGPTDYVDRSVLRQPEPMSEGYQALPGMPAGGGMLGSPLDWVQNNIFDPIAETGAQLTPLFNSAMTPGGPPVANFLSGLVGYDNAEHTRAGLSELGGAISQSGGNPLAFAEAQNKNFDERPMWQQLAAGAVYDPTNLLGVTALKKLGFIDDAAQYASDLGRVGSVSKNLAGVADDAIPRLGDYVLPKVGQLPAYADDIVQASDNVALAMGRGDKAWSAVPKVAGAADDAGESAVNAARRKLLDALDAEYKFRTSGEADALIHEGRVAQSQGIGDAITGLGSNANISEASRALSGGARVGEMLPRTAGVVLDDATQAALVREALAFAGDSRFDALNAVRALGKVQEGVRLQPAEIKNLRAIFGDEIADAVARTNAGRIATTAELTPADLSRIAKQAEVDGKRAATLEVKAQRQHELADQLQREARMDPTNKRLASAADDARARAIAQENEADRLLAERARALEGKQVAKADAAAQREATALNKAETSAAGKVDAAKASSDISDSGYKAVADIEKTIDELPVTPALKTQLKDSVQLWDQRNARVLDDMGDDAPGIMRRAYALATGEVDDSYTSALLTQEANLRRALEMQGMPSQSAKEVAAFAREMELKRRFGGNIPAHVQSSLDQAKALPYKGLRDDPVAAFASLSQTLKNTQFGIGDVAVFGQQGLKAVTTNSASIMAGIVNRIIGVMGLHPLGAIGDTLPKRVAYQLDGVAQGTHGSITDLSNQKTLLSAFGRPGKAADRAIDPIIQRMTDWQFGTVLGGLRNLIYEGNLLMAKVGGADITDPLVRRSAAEFANAATGAGTLAQRAGRANVEKALLLSPSMRRAQIQQLGQVTRLLNGTRTERILAASTIVSSVGSVLAVSKYLNDWIGVGEFVWDPSKPGFGDVTLPDGTVLNLFPQEQIPKALARSLGILMRDGLGEDEVKAMAQEWGKIGVTSASPPARFALAATGVGYDPGRGYAWGDLGEGKGWKDRLLDMAPVPPIFQQAAREGFDPLRTPANVLGVNAYEESPYDARDRTLANDASFEQYRIPNTTGPLTWDNLGALGRAEYVKKYGGIDPTSENARQSADMSAELLERQNASDTARTEGTLSPEQWRRDYTDRKTERYFRNDEIWKGTDFTPGADKVLNAYYSAIDAAEGPDGKVDWEKMDAYVAGLSEGDRKWIADNTGLVKISTPATEAFDKEYRKVKDSGWFDREDATWSGIAGTLGLPYQHYDDWVKAKREQAYSTLGVTTEDQKVAYSAEVEKFVNQDPIAKAMTEQSAAWRKEYAIHNPEAAFIAWKYGYWGQPPAEVRNYIRGALGK